MIRKLIQAFFRPGVNTTQFLSNIFKVPAGITADASGMYGLFGLMQNLDAIDLDIVPLVSSATAITLTPAQSVANVLDHSGAPGGGVTVTTPTAAQMLAALPSTIPPDGYASEFFYLNDSLGQTVTLVGGTGVTIIGTATIATATNRFYVLIANVNAGTVTLFNMGTMNL